MSASVERADDSSLQRTFRHAALAAAVTCAAFAAGCASPPTTTENSHSVRHTLRALLPQGGGLEVRDFGATRNEPLAPAVLTYRDARGSGQVSASVRRLPVRDSQQLSLCPDLSEHPYSRCTLTRLENGATLILDKSPVDEAKPSAGKRWTAVRTDRDGGQIAVSESNTSYDRSSSPSRPTPPLSGRQLTDIVISARWKPVLAAIPSPPPGSSPVSSFQYLPAAKITDIISRSVPRGLRTADRGGAAGYGHLTADDGRGRCLVAVTVQQWKPGDEALEKIFKGSAREADGTRVKITRSHPEKGGEEAVEWSVDTWRPDGLRIAVSELNAHAYRLPGTRRDPALGVGQLKKIALSEAWRAALSEKNAERNRR